MELKVENQGTAKASHLDLNLEIKDQVFMSRLYDKREAFKFDVVHMPFKYINMPYKMFYSTIIAAVLHICRPTSSSYLFSFKVLENL